MEIDRRSCQLEMEKLSLGRRIGTRAARSRLERIERELAELGEQQSGPSMPSGQKEKGAMMPSPASPEEIEQVQFAGGTGQSAATTQPGRQLGSTAPWPTSTRARGQGGGLNGRKPRKEPVA